MDAAPTVMCIASFLFAAAVCKASSPQYHGVRRLLTDGPPFYRPPLGYGGFNYRSAFEHQEAPAPQFNHTVRSAGPSGGHGLTAWAIVGIVFAVLAAGALVYFTALCYPVLCRRRRHLQLHQLEKKEQHV